MFPGDSAVGKARIEEIFQNSPKIGQGIPYLAQECGGPGLPVRRPILQELRGTPSIACSSRPPLSFAMLQLWRYPDAIPLLLDAGSTLPAGVGVSTFGLSAGQDGRGKTTRGRMVGAQPLHRRTKDDDIFRFKLPFWLIVTLISSNYRIRPIYQMVQNSYSYTYYSVMHSLAAFNYCIVFNTMGLVTYWNHILQRIGVHLA